MGPSSTGRAGSSSCSSWPAFPQPGVERYRGEVKYQIARSVLADARAKGRQVQWQIVENMLGLTGPADDEADPAAAKAAL